MDDNALDIILRLQDELSPALAKAQAAIRDAAKDMVAAGQSGAAGFDLAQVSWESFVSSVMDAAAHPLSTAREGIESLAVALGPVGALALATAAGLVLLGKEAYDLAENAAHVGENILDASLKMSATVPAVSELKFAAEAAGGSLDQVASLIFTMQQRMANNPDKFEQGLKDIGLSLNTIQSLSPDQKFLAIADALRTSGEETNKQAAAMDLFGRQGRDGLALMMQPLNDLIERGKDLGFIWTDTDAEAAKNLAIETRILGQEWDNLKARAGSDLIPALTALIKVSGDLTREFIGGADGGIALAVVMAGMANQFGTATAVLELLLGKTAELPKVSGDASKGITDWKNSLKDLQIGVPSLTDALTAQKEVEKDATDEAHNMADAMRILRDIESEEDQASMLYYTNRIKRIADLEKANQSGYGIDAQIEALRQLDALEQVEAVNVEHSMNSEQERAKVRGDAAKQHIDIINQIAALQLKNAALVNAGVTEALTQQIAYNKSIGLDAMGAIASSDPAMVKLAARLSEIALMHTTDAAKAALSAEANRTYTDTIIDEAKAIDAADIAFQNTIPKVHLIDDATAAADERFRGFKNTVQLTASSLDDLNHQLSSFYDQLAAQGNLGVFGAGGVGVPGSIGQPRVIGGLQTRDSGGPVTAGQPYYVGTGAQPELFIPNSNGTMVPSGAGGTTVNLTLQISYPLASAHDIADAVMPAITGYLRAVGVRF